MTPPRWAEIGRNPVDRWSCFARSHQNSGRTRSVWVHLDLNQGPAGYEPDALTAELWTQKPRKAGEGV